MPRCGSLPNFQRPAINAILFRMVQLAFINPRDVYSDALWSYCGQHHSPATAQETFCAIRAKRQSRSFPRVYPMRIASRSLARLSPVYLSDMEGFRTLTYMHNAMLGRVHRPVSCEKWACPSMKPYKVRKLVFKLVKTRSSCSMSVLRYTCSN